MHRVSIATALVTELRAHGTAVGASAAKRSVQFETGALFRFPPFPDLGGPRAPHSTPAPKCWEWEVPVSESPRPSASASSGLFCSVHSWRTEMGKLGSLLNQSQKTKCSEESLVLYQVPWDRQRMLQGGSTAHCNASSMTKR